MPQHRSCAKRMRQNRKRNPYNRAIRSRVKTATKRFLAAEEEEAELLFRQACSVLDRAANKGVIPRRRASRKKSRLARALEGRRPA